MNLGLVLTGGGARAAYQVGAIRAIHEITGAKESPFKIITGVSAGAINGSYLASFADDFDRATQGLWELWAGLHTDDIFKMDAAAFSQISSRWMRTLSMGGFLKSKKANYLLDTSPLRELLLREVKPDRFPQHFSNRHLRGIAFSVTNYLTGTAISFFDGIPELDAWVRSTRLGVRTPISVEHIMASSAIPVFFPPEKMNGVYYGDGCVRLTSPVSPAIHLGADRLITIGIRYFRTDEETIAINQSTKRDEITIAEIGGVLLNAVFLDSLETDVERMQRINKTVSRMSEEQRQAMNPPLRVIPVLTLRPSQDLGQLASGTLREFPGLIRFLLKGIGAKQDKGWDLLSYLAFEGLYTRQLLELGYQDTMIRRDEIMEFVFGDPSKIDSKNPRV